MIQKSPDEETAPLQIVAVTQPGETDLDSSSLSKNNLIPVNWLSGGRGLLIGVFLGIVLALLGSRLLLPKQTTNTTTELPQAIASNPPSQSVTVEEVTTTSVNRTLETTGTVAAFELIPVFSQATGLQIRQLLVDEGVFVKEGQILAYLDDSVLQAQLTQAKASVAQAEARLAELKAGTRSEEIAQGREQVKSAQAEVTQAQSDLDLVLKRVERNRTLEAQGAIALDRLDEILNQKRISQSSLQQAQARLGEAQQQLAQLQAGPRQEVITQAVAQLAQAKGQMQLVTAQLKDARVVAPRGGKVVSRNARVGRITSTSEQLFTIIENGRLELRVRIPETQLPQIRSNQKVTITSDGDSNLRLVGRVREVVSLVDEESRQATVKVDLPNNSSLKPGMFLRASIITSKAQGLTVPVKAILPQADGRAIAYLLQDDNTVTEQLVELGEILPEEQVEIVKGLKSGDRLIVEGAAYVKDGDLVKVIDN